MNGVAWFDAKPSQIMGGCLCFTQYTRLPMQDNCHYAGALESKLVQRGCFGLPLKSVWNK